MGSARAPPVLPTLSRTALMIAGEANLDAHVTVHGFEFVALISETPNARVFRALSHRFGRNFAIKVYNRVADQRARLEFDVIRRLAHPGIISPYDLFEWDGRTALVLDYCEGGSLQDEIVRLGPGGCSRERFLLVAHQVIVALDFLHSQRVCHGSVIPSHVIFRDVERRAVKLIGFGSAGGTGTQAVCDPLNVVFEPPEAFGGGRVDPVQRDVWMCGVTLAFLANGHSPWLTDDARIIPQIVEGGRGWFNNSVDDEVRDLLESMLQPATRRTRLRDLLELPVWDTADVARGVARSQSVDRSGLRARAFSDLPQMLVSPLARPKVSPRRMST